MKILSGRLLLNLLMDFGFRYIIRRNCHQEISDFFVMADYLIREDARVTKAKE